MSKAWQMFLIICYGIAWLMSSSEPLIGFLFLASIGTLISIPGIFKNVLKTKLITLILVALVAAIPCFAPILVIWLIYRVLAKINEILENFVLLIFSFLLYGILLFIPFVIRVNIVSSIHSPELVAAIMFAIGALIIHLTCHVFEMFGHKRTKTPAFIIGLPGFLIMLVIFISSIHGADTAEADSPHNSD